MSCRDTALLKIRQVRRKEARLKEWIKVHRFVCIHYPKPLFSIVVS